MPERGWSVLTVLEDTANRVKELARTRDLPVDEMVAELVSPARKERRSIREAFGLEVKSSNLHERIKKVHPALTVKT
jgi:hypothetical protein